MISPHFTADRNLASQDASAFTTPGRLQKLLEQDNSRYRGTGGVSSGNRSAGYLPAFRDDSTGRVYLSRFSNGRLAPIHLLDGLPDALVKRPLCSTQTDTPCPAVTAGFVHGGEFFTRNEVAVRVHQGSSALPSR